MRGREQCKRGLGLETFSWQWLLWAVAACVAASGSSTGLAQPARRVAVLELERDALGEDKLATDVVQHVRAVLSERRELQLHESHASLAQLSFSSGCNAEGVECLAKVCRQLAVDILLVGRIQHERGTSRVQLSRYDAASGRLAGRATVTLAAGATAELLQLRARELVSEALDFEPSAAASGGADSTSGSAPDPLDARYQTQPRGLDGRLITGYALLGGAVVSTGLSVLSWVQIDRAQANDSFAAYRRSVGQLSPNARDVCDEAKQGQSHGLDSASFAKVKNSCSTGKTFEVLQFVFLGGAVVSSGLAAYLLFGGASERPKTAGTVTLHPSVGRRGASLGARIHF